MGSDQGKEKITVETLLQLKRNEKPAEDFWDNFEKDFHRRRLNALMEKGTRSAIGFISLFKALAFALPALLLVGATVFWSRSSEQPLSRAVTASSEPVVFDSGEALAQVEIAQPEAAAIPDFSPGRVSNQFVLDAIQTSPSSGASFRKVLYTPAIRLSPSNGASYVRDNLSSSDYRVTTADLKLGRNF